METDFQPLDFGMPEDKSHRKMLVAGSQKVWYQRLKIITLPRHLVVWE
ncbi:MAG: hypothetical protein K6A82_08300 [Prevotella sp.]|nr:hypothetical protein [Prevotella sp.]